jgi:GT2 family glycosyltransferase
VFVDPATKPIVLAILPTLAKNLDSLLKCIKSVKESDFHQTLSLVVIVNDPDAVLNPIDGARIISPGLNLGFNGGLVFGSQLFESEFIWILQDDVQVNSSTLSALYNEMVSNPRISMLSPRRKDSQGNFPTCGGWVDTNGTITGFYSEALNDSRSYKIPRKLNWVSSSGSLIRKTMWETLGGYDLDLYPLGFGDVDFCDRATTQGFEFSLSDVAIIQHEHLSSSTPSLLRDFLYQSTGQIFSRKKQMTWKATPISNLVDPEIVAKIAQRASVIIPKLSEFASHEHLHKQLHQAKMDHEHLHKQLHQAQFELKAITQSRIWRISKPYRLLRTYLKNL